MPYRGMGGKYDPENRLTVLLCYEVSAVKVVQSCPTLCNPWNIVCQAPLSMEFSSQEYWSGLPFLAPRDLPNPGIKQVSCIVGGFFTI